MSHRWTCPRCNTLLGIRKGNWIEFRYKTVWYSVKNPKSVVAVCRNCGNRVTEQK